MRKLLYLAIAIVVLGGGGMLAIYLISDRPDAPGQAAAPPPPQAADLQPSGMPLPGKPDLSRFATGGNVPAPMQYAPAPPPPPPGSWEAVPITQVRGMGRMGAALQSLLNDLSPLLASCVASAPPAPQGPSTVTTSAAAGSDETTNEGDTPTLVLHVEGQAGALRIVDAPVFIWGGASDGVVTCAQGVLRGKSITAPAARAGEKFRIPHVLPKG